MTSPATAPLSSRSFIVAAIIVLLFGAVLAAPGLAAPGSSQVFVFTSLLFGDPDNLVGTLELRLVGDPRKVGDPDEFRVLGMALLKRLPVPYTTGEITDQAGIVVIAMGDPEEYPPQPCFPPDPCRGEVTFTVDTTIPAAVAARMVGNPNDFTVTVFTAAGPVATGPLRSRGFGFIIPR
jgi:hypothetical protein